jgi:hypothetical protein
MPQSNPVNSSIPALSVDFSNALCAISTLFSQFPLNPATSLRGTPLRNMFGL